MKVTYICPNCGVAKAVSSFWKWFSTPHFGAKKRFKCEYCGERHWMSRLDGVKFFDLPYTKHPKVYRITLKKDSDKRNIWYYVDAPNRRIAAWSGANLYNNEYYDFKAAKDMNVERVK